MSYILPPKKKKKKNGRQMMDQILKQVVSTIFHQKRNEGQQYERTEVH